MSAKKLTRAEVAEHKSNKSCWFVIGNKVYDVSKFLDEHPGGCEVLLEQAGQDATEVFEDVGHSTDARHMREDYLVGEIVEDECQQYSYDKKTFTHAAGDNKQRGQNDGANPLVMVALMGVIVALMYYLLF